MPQKSELLYSSVSDGTFSIHRRATAPDPVAHDTPTLELARLFAAAPEMLRVLKTFVEDIESAYPGPKIKSLAFDWPDIIPTYDAARWAIKLAVTGE